MAKKKSNDQLTKFIAQRRSYLIGVLLGLTLILINSVIGLYVIDLVLESADDSDIVDFEELPVPEIAEQPYTNFRDDYLERQTRVIEEFSESDPFNTN